MIVLDTHIWLWFMLGSEQLEGALREQIESAPNEVLISSITVWEALLLGERKRIIMKPSPNEFLRKALRTFPFEVAPINEEIALLSRELKFKHQDPADRFIAATAYVNEAALATNDDELRKLSWLKLI